MSDGLDLEHWSHLGHVVTWSTGVSSRYARDRAVTLRLPLPMGDRFPAPAATLGSRPIHQTTHESGKEIDMRDLTGKTALVTGPGRPRGATRCGVDPTRLTRLED
jgi:hypothetical protein